MMQKVTNTYKIMQFTRDVKLASRILDGHVVACGCLEYIGNVAARSLLLPSVARHAATQTVNQ